MIQSHQQLIEFQTKILECIVKDEDPIDLAKRSREFLTSFYGASGYGFPSGAELGINVNNSCNLRCGHCYYANTHLGNGNEDNSLSEEEWKKVISDAGSLGINHISIIGKEPLFSPKKTLAILKEIERQRKQGNELRYELITNGTLIEKEIHWLSEFPDFYFFSISFDGFERDHDKVRGEGNYEKAREGLRIAKNAGIKNLSATFSAMPHNSASLQMMLEDLTPIGLEYVSIGFCFPTQFNKKEFHSDLIVFDSVISQLERAPETLDISINLMGDENANLIRELLKRDYFDRQKLAVTQDCAPSLVIPLNNKPRTAVQLSILPIMFYSGFRLDYDGTAIDFCKDLQIRQRKGFGNIRQKPLRQLYQTAQSLWQSYTEKYFQTLIERLR
jgi:MoaA/NifB/PqqE/SkfB family radical SAM enzyme